MLREREWRFERKTEDVLEAALAKRAHHDDRIAFWRAEQERTMAEIKEKGLDVTAHEITGGVRAQVNIDERLSSRLTECQTKLRSHQGKASEFALWVEVLGNEEGTRPLSLDWDDMQFFFAGPVESRTKLQAAFD